MPEYDKCPVVLCLRTDSRGSIEILVGRRLPHNLFSFAVFLVDLWKLGLKGAWGEDRLDTEGF